MKHVLRVAWTIARRDYVAIVFSRLFLIFLLLPLVFFAVGGVFGAIGAQDHDVPARPVVAVVGEGFNALDSARTRLTDRLGDDVLPPLTKGSDKQAIATLSGGLAHPHLALGPRAPDELEGQIDLLVQDARAARALGDTSLPAVTVERPSATASAPMDDRDRERDRVSLARGAQYAVLVLTIMLAGRLLSSFIEERSNKVIEILAAVAPVDAIFLGKLLGMLMFSLTCILAWGGIALGGALAFLPAKLAAIPAPAVGWVVFVPLALAYFSSSFLLLGAVMLGLGAQANSPADIQTLALPTTMGQLMLFGLASVDVSRPEHWVAYVAAIFPFSSPLAMLARGAERATLWPHLLAILWQAAWLALAIRVAATRFRRAVLKSGGGRKAKLTSSS
ncbi:MAG: transporter permease [Sphingomonas bacterium]|nr:transporter permease [Sphingomonas bacterium]